jgi:hypothetical protein
MIKSNPSGSGKSKQSRLVRFFVLTLGLVICGLNVVQVLIVSRKTKNSVEQNYIEDCEQITAAYSLSIAF